MIIPIPGTFIIARCWSYLDYHPWMVTISRIVTIPRMATNSTDQTRASFPVLGSVTPIYAFSLDIRFGFQNKQTDIKKNGK